MARQTIIELTTDVTKELLEKEFRAIDYDHIPFEKFTVKFPMSIYLSKEQMLRDISKEVGRPIDPIKNNNVMREIDKYIDSNVSVHVDIDQEKKSLAVTVIDPKNITIFQFTSLKMMPLPFVQKNTFSKTPSFTAMGIIRMIGNIIDYVTSPTVIIRAREIKEEKKPSNKKKKQKKNGQKSYIYKTIYHVDHIQDSYRPTRTYERHTDCWAVRGHWREYKNPDGSIKKKVWIKEQTRGEGKEVAKEYRITKLDTETK